MPDPSADRNSHRTFPDAAWPNWRRGLFALAAKQLLRLEEDPEPPALRVTTPAAAVAAPWVLVDPVARRWQIAGAPRAGERGYFGLCQFLDIPLAEALAAADDGRDNRPARRRRGADE